MTPLLLLRAERLEWIAVALQTRRQIVRWDRDTKTYDKTRRVTLVCGNYVVVIALTRETSARFITAYVANTPSTRQAQILTQMDAMRAKKYRRFDQAGLCGGLCWFYRHWRRTPTHSRFPPVIQVLITHAHSRRTQTVQARSAYAEAIGWTLVSREEAEARRATRKED
ncbi:MAG: hypothetical protein R3F31_20725 [Verrucomicrobiales bacterium]